MKRIQGPAYIKYNNLPLYTEDGFTIHKHTKTHTITSPFGLNDKTETYQTTTISFTPITNAKTIPQLFPHKHIGTELPLRSLKISTNNTAFEMKAAITQMPPIYFSNKRLALGPITFTVIGDITESKPEKIKKIHSILHPSPPKIQWGKQKLKNIASSYISFPMTVEQQRSDEFGVTALTLKSIQAHATFDTNDLIQEQLATTHGLNQFNNGADLKITSDVEINLPNAALSGEAKLHLCSQRAQFNTTTLEAKQTFHINV